MNAKPEWLEFDRQHIWHPYSTLPGTGYPLPVSRAHGCEIILQDGRTLLDGMASWWSAIHGYNHPFLNDAISHQLSQMAHVMFGGLTHEPAVRLAQQLIDITPKDLQKIFFSDSGSVAVEVAIKMALQYWVSQDRPEKNQLLALRGGYHGDTFGAMSVCDPVTGMHHLFAPALPQQRFAERPRCRFGEPATDADLADFHQQLEQRHSQIAAVILEPIVQGAGGMWFYSAEFLKRVHHLCRDYGVLLIADEIATGFGRTGKLFACEHAGICPDILCVGKALTGGYLSLAATLCTEAVCAGIGSGRAATLMHGPTFMANPLACAVANASLTLLRNSDWINNVQRIGATLRESLEPVRRFRGVNDVRTLGAIAVIELEQPVDTQRLQPLLLEEGLWLRPFGKLVYTMPPYCLSPSQLNRLGEGMSHSLSRYLTT